MRPNQSNQNHGCSKHNNVVTLSVITYTVAAVTLLLLLLQQLQLCGAVVVARRAGDFRHWQNNEISLSGSSSNSWRPLTQLSSSRQRDQQQHDSSSGSRLHQRRSIESALTAMHLMPTAEEHVVDFDNGIKLRSTDEISDDELPATNETLQSYIKKNCTRCLVREEAKFNRIEQIQRDLKEKLGFHRLPNISRSDLPDIPNTGHLSGILRSLGYQSDEPFRYEDHEDSYRAKTERIFTLGVTSPFLAAYPATASVISYFEFSPETISSDVEKAHLHFYVNPPSKFQHQEPSPVLKMVLYRITDISTPTAPKTELVDTKEIKLSQLRRGHWERFDVKKLVTEWFRKPMKNYGLIVVVQYKDEGLVTYPSSGDQRHNMYIDMITKYGERARRKRESSSRLDCTVQSQETRCCRYPLVIDFEKFGWDWVIAPKRYYANYCSGECPLRYLQANLHTHLAQQMGGNAGPCCTAADVAPIQMIYFNDNKEILIAKVPGMIVTRCACA